MNKRGHLTITAPLAEGLPRTRRLALKLGCVLPDLLVYTYLVGHTWDSSRERLFRRLEWLAAHGRPGPLSYLALGYSLHYVEDYFTWPHNSGYPGSLADHVRYERNFTCYLEALPEQEPGERWGVVPVELAVTYLEWLHSRYLAGEAGFRTDCRYIRQAAAMVAQSFAAIFERNRCRVQAALPEELLALPGAVWERIP